MKKTFWLAAAASVLVTSPAFADVFEFDFAGTVLAETRPNLSVTPRPITGSLSYTAPVGGATTTLTGSANLMTSLYGDFFFSSYTTTLSGDLFTFSGEEGGQRFSLRASALPGGGFGFRNAPDGFSLTGTPVNASGRLNGTFAGAASPSAVPEPASWMLLIAGVGALGGMLRRRRSGRLDVTSGKRYRITYA